MASNFVDHEKYRKDTNTTYNIKLYKNKYYMPFDFSLDKNKSTLYYIIKRFY